MKNTILVVVRGGIAEVFGTLDVEAAIYLHDFDMSDSAEASAIAERAIAALEPFYTREATDLDLVALEETQS